MVKSSFKGNYKYYEGREEKEKRLSVTQYLNKITPHLYDLINDQKMSRRAWKIQISMCINLRVISSKYICTIYAWSNNESIMWGRDTDDIIREIFSSFLNNYQEVLKIIKGWDFVFESGKLMDYKLHRVRLRRGGSYIKSSEWLLRKGATINSKNKTDDECLRWSTISALNYKEIMKKEFENMIMMMIKNIITLLKNKIELYWSEWLRSRKESLINKDNCFQNALNDSLDYQRIKKHHEKISKFKPYVNL